MKYDWHGYSAKLAQIKKSIEKSKLSGKNKRIIFDFEKYLITTGLSKPRVLKYLEILKSSALFNRSEIFLNNLVFLIYRNPIYK